MSVQRIEVLEKQYHELLQRIERLDQAENKLDFIARDSSVKIGVAEGLAENTYKELSRLKIELIQVKAEIKLLRTTNDQQFEDVHKKFDKQEELLREHGSMLRQLLEKSS
ncbi:MAG TPA: hypothetical protein VN207_04850 [Ktedonobacteraceae bacterium]|nr:hypothetical protein [Ktedonobacteraceae bacterium]